MKINEKEFKNRLVPDFEKEGLNILDLKSSVLDLFIDTGKRYFVELKIAKKGYKSRSKKKGLDLSTQTEIIKKMENLPIILACDEDDPDTCNLVTPEKLKTLTEKRINRVSKKGKPYDILIGVHNLHDCVYTYNEMIRNAKDYILS